MKRRLVVAGIVSLGLSGVLLAASPHWKHGAQPVCTIAADGSGHCTSGEVAGLGNGDVLIVVTLTASEGTFCHSPGNGKIVPGRNPATGSSTGGTFLSNSQIKNGSLTVPSIDVAAPVVSDIPTPQEAGCPNANWTVTLDGVITYDGFYSFQQPAGQQINRLSFAF